MNYKEILNEWNSFLLKEASQINFSRQMEEEFPSEFEVFKSRKNEIGNFRDVYFNQIILNTLRSDNQAHGPSELIDIYQEYTISIQPFINRSEEQLIIVSNSGTVYNLHSKFTGGHNSSTCTYDDIVNFLNAKLDKKDVSSKKTQAILDIEIEKSRNKSSRYFDFICEDENYIVFHPKTAFGSRIIARSVCVNNQMIYDNSSSTGRGKLTGKMTWCTAAASKRNQFNVYKEGNSHLYYCIKKYNSFEELIDDKENEKRKCSFAFLKRIDSNRKITVTFHTGGASVNGDNQRRNEEWFKNLLGNLYNLINEDIRSDEREVFDLEGHYRAINVEIFKQNRNVAIDQGLLGDFCRELNHILSYSHDRKIIALLCINDEEEEIRKTFATYSGLFKEDEEIVNFIFENFDVNEDEYINSQYLRILNYKLSDYPEILDYIERKAKKENSIVANQLTSRNDIFEIDPSGRLFEILVNNGYYSGYRSSGLANMIEKAPEKIKQKFKYLSLSLKFENISSYYTLKEVIDEIESIKETDIEKYDLIIKTINSFSKGTNINTKIATIFSDSALKSIFYSESLKSKNAVDFSKIPFDLDFEDPFEIDNIEITGHDKKYNVIDEVNYIPTEEDLEELTYYYNYYQHLLSGLPCRLIFDEKEDSHMSIVSQVKIDENIIKSYVLSNIEYFKGKETLESLIFNSATYSICLDILKNFIEVYSVIEKIKKEINISSKQLALDLEVEIEKIKNSIKAIFSTDLNSIQKKSVSNIVVVGINLYQYMSIEKAKQVLPDRFIIFHTKKCIELSSKIKLPDFLYTRLLDLIDMSKINISKKLSVQIFSIGGGSKLNQAREFFRSKSFNTEAFKEIINSLYGSHTINPNTSIFSKLFNLETIVTNVKLYECFDDIEFIRKIVKSIKKQNLNQMCKVVIKIIETKDMQKKEKYLPHNRTINAGPFFPENLDISDQGIKNFIQIIREDSSLPIAKNTLKNLESVYSLKFESVSFNKEIILENYIRNQLLYFI